MIHLEPVAEKLSCDNIPLEEKLEEESTTITTNTKNSKEINEID